MDPNFVLISPKKKESFGYLKQQWKELSDIFQFERFLSGYYQWVIQLIIDNINLKLASIIIRQLQTNLFFHMFEVFQTFWTFSGKGIWDRILMSVTGSEITLDVSLIYCTVKQIAQILYDDSNNDYVYLFYLGFSSFSFATTVISDYSK